MAYSRADKLSGPFFHRIGEAEFSHQFRETWVKLGSETVRCGIGANITLNWSTGVSVKELTSVTETIESSIGVPSVAAVKGVMADASSSETLFSETRSSAVSFECPAPECGRRTYDFYQLARDHVVELRKKRLFRSPRVVHIAFRELTNHRDIRVERDEADQDCPCPDLTDRSGPVALLQLGTLTVRLDCDNAEGKRFSFSWGKRTLSIDLGGGTTRLTLPREELPQFLLVLSGIADTDQLVTVSAQIVENDGLFSWERSGQAAPSLLGVFQGTLLRDQGNANEGGAVG